LDELKNADVKITLLHAIKDIPIYEKTIELCIKKTGKKRKYSTTI